MTPRLRKSDRGAVEFWRMVGGDHNDLDLWWQKEILLAVKETFDVD